jgi:hypothetical protein
MPAPLPGPDDTSTDSLRKERGEPSPPDPRERLADVPLGPSSIGVVGEGPRSEPTEAERERDGAEPGGESQAG